MDDSKKVVEELRALRKEQTDMKQRLAMLEQHVSAIEGKDIHVTEPVSSSTDTQEEDEQSSTNVPAVICLVLGLLFTITVVGAIIGIPLLILAIYLFSKGTSADSSLTDEDAAQEQTDDDSTQDEPSESISFDSATILLWLGRVGLLAIVLGAMFFVGYAVDMGWINQMMQLVLAFIFGLVLFGIGELAARKEKYKTWGFGLVGAGLAILYFTGYASYYFEYYRDAVGSSAIGVFIYLLVIVGLAVLLSIVHNSQVMAGGAFFLAYVTLLASEVVLSITVVYSLLLLLGLVVLSSYKQWFTLGFSGLFAGYGVYALWSFSLSVSFGLSLLYLVIGLLAFTFLSFVQREYSLSMGTVTSVVNAFLFYVLGLSLFLDFHPDYISHFTFAVALFYGLLCVKQTVQKPDYSSIAHQIIGWMLLALGILLYFDGALVTVFWSLQLLVIAGLHRLYPSQFLRVVSYVLASGVFLKVLSYDSYTFDGWSRMAVFLITAFSLYVLWWLLQQTQDMSSDERSGLHTFAWLATALVFLVVLLEVGDLQTTVIWTLLVLVLLFVGVRLGKVFTVQADVASMVLGAKVLLFDSFMLSGNERLVAFGLAILVLYALSSISYHRSEHGSWLYSVIASTLLVVILGLHLQDYLISVSWTVLAALLLLTGFVTARRSLRIQGLVVFLLTIFKVFFIDTQTLEPIFRTVSFVVLGVILVSLSFLYTKYKDKFKDVF